MTLPNIVVHIDDNPRLRLAKRWCVPAMFALIVVLDVVRDRTSWSTCIFLVLAVIKVVQTRRGAPLRTSDL
jgi:hypothetical protein